MRNVNVTSILHIFDKEGHRSVASILEIGNEKYHRNVTSYNQPRRNDYWKLKRKEKDMRPQPIYIDIRDTPK